MIILITAWLCSKMYKLAPWWEDSTFEETKSTLDNSGHSFDTGVLFWGFARFSDISLNDVFHRTGWSLCVWLDFECITSIIKSQGSSAGMPSMGKPASKEIISASVELCETDVSFLHIQLVGTNVWLPKIHNVPPEVDIESSRSPAKSESRNSPNLHCCAAFPHDNTFYIHSWNECKRSNVRVVCHKHWSILWSHVQVCWLIIEYVVYRCEPNRDIPEILWAHFWLFSHGFQFFFFELMVIKTWNWHLIKLLSCFVSQLAISFYTFLCIAFHIAGPEKMFSFLRAWSCFRYCCGSCGFEHGSVIVHSFFACFALSLSTSQVFVVKKWCWFSQINLFIKYFTRRIKKCFCPANFVIHTYRQEYFSRCTNKYSQLRAFSQTCSNRTFSNCRSHNSPAKGWPYRFRLKERLGLPYWTKISAICVVVDESKCLDIPIWRFSIISNHLPFWLGASRYCVGYLSCASRWSWYDIHQFGLCHLWCWWSLLCKYCIRAWIVFHNVASEHNSTFVLLVFRLQFGMLQMTDVHQWGKMHRFPSFLASSITSDLFMTFVRFHAGIFSSFPIIFIHCCFCCRYLHCLRHRSKFVHLIVMM